MKVRYIVEPSLQFGENQHICPKYGIFNHNPFDITQVRPERITIGIIGKGESVDKVLIWIESCKHLLTESKVRTPTQIYF